MAFNCRSNVHSSRNCGHIWRYSVEQPLASQMTIYPMSRQMLSERKFVLSLGGWPTLEFTTSLGGRRRSRIEESGVEVFCPAKSAYRYSDEGTVEIYAYPPFERKNRRMGHPAIPGLKMQTWATQSLL